MTTGILAVEPSRTRVVICAADASDLDGAEVRFPAVRFALCDNSTPGLLSEADILFVRRWMSDHELQLLPRTLRWLHIEGVGVDHVVPRLPDHIHPIITNGRGLSSDLIAEYALCVLMMLRWQMPRAVLQQQQHRWERWTTSSVVGTTLALIGLGEVGRAIAKRAVAIGMKVIGARRQPGPVRYVEEVYAASQLHRVLSLADSTIVAVPLTAATEGMVDSAAIESMRRGSYLVNIGRGRVVSETALLSALASGHLAGAALDVFAQEPLSSDSPLWDAPNLIITPHIAGAMSGLRVRAVEFFFENLQRFLQGEPLRSVVNRETGY